MIQVITEKTLCSKDFTSNLRDMKVIVTIIPTYLVTNLLLSSFSFLKNQKQESGFQQGGALVTRTISVFHL